jgi:uncharacterized protein involved in tolerance to divalent cations
MNTPFYSVDEFINQQIDEVLEKYQTWLQEKECQGKTKRRG